MRNIRTIAGRELAAYFATPVATVFIVIFLLLTGFFTFTIGNFFERGEASLVSFFTWHPWLYLFLVPAVGMRLWSEERRLGTMELLLTMPVTTWQAIVGKFLASWLFLLLALALTFPIWLTVNYLGSPDNGVILASYIGSFLLAGAMLSVASCVSALTRNQVIAFILGIGVCLLLVVSGVGAITDSLRGFLPSGVVDLLASASMLTRFIVRFTRAETTPGASASNCLARSTVSESANSALIESE